MEDLHDCVHGQDVGVSDAVAGSAAAAAAAVGRVVFSVVFVFEEDALSKPAVLSVAFDAQDAPSVLPVTPCATAAAASPAIAASSFVGFWFPTAEEESLVGAAE